MNKKIKRIHFESREKWREWLEKNHLIEEKIEFVRYKKHTGKPSPSHKEAMCEAICFGWIDTTAKRIDDRKYLITFVRRNLKGRWSNATQGYARRLIEEGKMSSHGLKMYEHGLTKPVIDHGLPKNPETPRDLIKELNKNKKAKDNFESLAPSYRRNYIYWIERAKREETRARRIREVIKNLEVNKKLWEKN